MLTVICGGMFSEKSTELQRRGKRLERAGKEVMYFKPDFDSRYSDDEIVTHDGSKVKAFNIPVDKPDNLLGVDFSDIGAILIDEIQFINVDIYFVIKTLLERYEGLEVIVAGLDMDYESYPFTTTTVLMAQAEKIIKLNAVCSSCGSDSWVSYKSPNGKRLELGTDEYTPLCRTCFNKKRKGGN